MSKNLYAVLCKNNSSHVSFICDYGVMSESALENRRTEYTYVLLIHDFSFSGLRVFIAIDKKFDIENDITGAINNYFDDFEIYGIFNGPAKAEKFEKQNPDTVIVWLSK